MTDHTTRTHPVSAIILDAFDTTLVLDQDVTAYNPFKEMLREMGIESPSACVGHDRAMLLTQKTDFKDYLAHYAKDQSYADCQALLIQANTILKYQYNAYKPREEWQDFVTLAQQKNITLCIGSNLATPYTRIVTDKLGEVTHHAFSCEMGVMKPQKEFFWQCCEMMKAKPENTIMIGNSYTSDILGAQNAGLADAFWLPKTGVNPSPDNRAVIIRKLTDVFAYIPH